MSDEIPGVAERLAEEFADVPARHVMETVCRCAGDCESASPMFVEQAARACLRDSGTHGEPAAPA